MLVSAQHFSGRREQLRHIFTALPNCNLSVMGKYDTVLVVEAPDDETIAKLTLAIGSLGNVRTETLRAFTEDEYRKIIADLR